MARLRSGRWAPSPLPLMVSQLSFGVFAASMVPLEMRASCFSLLARASLFSVLGRPFSLALVSLLLVLVQLLPLNLLLRIIRPATQNVSQVAFKDIADIDGVLHMP